MEHLGKELARLLDDHQCDMLVAPTSMDLPLDLGGLPSVSVPIGFYSTNRNATKNAEGMITKGPNIP
jgi:hypothetical protein